MLIAIGGYRKTRFLLDETLVWIGSKPGWHQPDRQTLPSNFAAVITPNCTLHAASLVRPISGWFLLSVTFCQDDTSIMGAILRQGMTLAYGNRGKKAALPMTDLGDDRSLIRFVSNEPPRVVSGEDLELMVQPAPGSILKVETEIRPMRSAVSIIPIMLRIIVFQFVPQKRGGLG